MGRRLHSAERDSYDHVTPATLARTRIHSFPWLPGSFLAITLGRRILLTTKQPDDGTSHLIAHELVHVEQWSERGVRGFLIWYVGDFATQLRQHRRWMPAYRDVEAEVEARNIAQEWFQRRRNRY